MIKIIHNIKIPLPKLAFSSTLTLIILTACMSQALASIEICFENEAHPAKIISVSAWQMAQPQQPNERIITGVVRDSSGSILPGVSIVVKGTTTGTTTDLNGRYSLSAPQGSILLVSMVGYESQETILSPNMTSNHLDFVLLENQSAISEVVVTAFGGATRRQDMIGSVSSINPTELKIPSSNLTTALAGRVAGMIAYQRSGEPGMDNADFFIRGVTTFGYKQDPLILIDNMEVTATDLARLQVDDIASFSIMKDATATAVYGARGANGVILITTKQGREGRATVAVRYENSLSAPTRDVELADPITYMQLHNRATVTRPGYQNAPHQPETILNTLEGIDPERYPMNDWRSLLLKNQAHNQRFNMSVRGGGSIARYFVSGGFNHDTGILNVDGRSNFNTNINLKSYSLRSNVDINLTKSTEMTVRLNGSFDDYRGPLNGGAQVYNQIMNVSPVAFPTLFSPGPHQQHIKHLMFGNIGEGNYLNPYAELVKGYKDYSRSVMGAQLELKQDLSNLTEGLRFRVMANTTRNSYFDVNRNYDPFYYRVGPPDLQTGVRDIVVINPTSGTEYLKNYIEGDKTLNSVFYLESTLNYERTLAERHRVSGLLVYIMRNYLDGNAGSLQTSLPYRNLGVSGRTTYAYDSRYFLEFNFGYNGSERFHHTKRFGFFPSAGLAWSVSNEAFWTNLRPVVNNLRLRATYGLVGNDAIGAASDRFFYLSEVNMEASNRGAYFGIDREVLRQGISVSRYANQDITWETSYKTNLALEIGLFNKLQFVGEYFRDHRKNILMTREYTPSSLGLAAALRANVGEAFSEGIDASIDYQHNINRNWWIQSRGNFTYATGKYKVFEEPEYGLPYLSRVGKPINQVYGYLADRLFIDDQEVANSPRQSFGQALAGDIKYVDINNDGQITALDRVPLGYPTTPEIVYGFGFSLGFKNIDFSTFFQGSGRSSFWIDPVATAPFIESSVSGRRGIRQLLNVYADSHWSEENRDIYALYPRLSTNLVTNNTQTNSWFMRNGAFLRLKQVELGYTLPTHLTQQIKINSLRVYANATNLMTWSHFKLWDVEMGGNGLGYPIQSVINFGINLNL